MVLRGDQGMGYIRVDWFTPDGLSTWGDGRLTILGTDGFIEIRKNVDIAGRAGGNHLFLVDQKETRYIDCSKSPLPYGAQLVNDINNRTETAMSQEHCFLATEVASKLRNRHRESTSANKVRTASGSDPVSTWRTTRVSTTDPVSIETTTRSLPL